MVKEIIKKIEKAQNIVIAGHVSPDGDAIGSALALREMILQVYPNKDVKVNFNDELPDYVEKMNIDQKIYKEVTGDIDLLISVDTANIERLAVTEDMIKRAKFKIVIDHHISNHNYFDINYVKNISAASELIYDFVEPMGVKLTKRIAKFMYLGIINDTGCFRHPNVTKDTFEIASKLMETGIDNNEIYMYLFSKSRKKAEIFSRCIVEGIYDEKLKFQYFYLPKEEVAAKGYKREDSDGASEYMLSIRGVRVSLFMKQEEDGSIKGSFRADGSVDVNTIASNFNGGGHFSAAGFKTDMSAEEIIKKTKELLNEKVND